MGNIRILAAAISLLAASGRAPAIAGPCSDQIDAISRTLAGSPTAAGASTTRTLNAAGPDGAKSIAVPLSPSGQTQETTPQGNSAKRDDRRVAAAEQQLDRARTLDAKDDPACRQAANQASHLARPD